jgi:hypothetical protein
MNESLRSNHSVADFRQAIPHRTREGRGNPIVVIYERLGQPPEPASTNVPGVRGGATTGFELGTIRTVWLVPRVGARSAELLKCLSGSWSPSSQRGGPFSACQ